MISQRVKGAFNGVVEQFGLRHSLLLQRLAPNAERLDMVHALTRPRDPLTVAMMSPFPWRGIGVATYVLQETGDNGPLQGFVQALKRPERPEGDLLALAPALTGEQPEAEEIWMRLLTHMASEAGYHGVQRVFASAPADGREADVLRQAGFVPYTQETIFRLEAGSGARSTEAAAGIRRQQEEDAWAIQRLYHMATPPLVQHAESPAASESKSFLPAWWESGLHIRGYVIGGAEALTAAVQIASGPAGHWLRLWSSDNDAQAAGRLVDGCLAAMEPERRARPLYLALRDYQGGLRAMLEARGFSPYLRRTRLVKHLVVRVRETEPVLLPAPGLASGVLALFMQSW